MKKYLKNIIGILGCILIVSCSDYLDVQPEDKYLEEDVFSSETGIQTALNGIYSNMTSNNTYGSNLTMSTVDVLGQRYNLVSDRDAFHYYAIYDYENTGVKTTFDKIWTGLYTNILNINNFIQGIETYKENISDEKRRLLKGEAIALRAMHHLDLLRLYGPIYSVNAEDKSIPYYTEAKAELNPLLSATEVITKILADLTTAEELLENDPVREFGKVAIFQDDDDDSGYNGTDFYRFRNLRLNYYAVKALQARANLYAGNKEAALTVSKAVIEEASKWFEWTPPQKIISAGGNPDRTFSSEVLFAMQNIDLYNNHKNLFASALNDNSILAPEDSRLNNEIFENNQNDYRYNPIWALPAVGEKQYKTCFKFADVSDNRKEFRFRQPLIRISEMYYIAAETETDPAIALTYLNTVRFNRGLVNLEVGVNIPNEILKEYQKEFYGEGQLFFYYKRNNFTSIPNGSSPTGNITMGKDQYVVPLPLSESDFRQ